MEISLEQVITIVSLYGLRIIGSIFIFLIGKKVANFLSALTVKAMERSKVDITLTKFFSSVVYGVLLIVVILAALSNLGIETVSFVAIFGAMGLAVGLAFKDTFANVGAGVLLIVFRPFKVGDYVNTGGEAGTVEEINLFSVQLKTPDNKLIIIPNNKIIGSNITNFSAMPTRRVDFLFSVGYEDDLRLVKKTLQDLIGEDDRILSEPSPLVAVLELAQSSVNFTVRVWVKSPDYWGVYYDTTEKVKLAFDANGISIPFPQLQLRQN
ncbi:MAG: mechanosensitive ion channel [Campylobacteraceae bacterium]|nr:mechanosensitive ion channel [Campylobacteraceae bacterium]